MPATRYALLIGNSHYPSEPTLDDLQVPEQDAEGVATVLRDPQIGRFDEVQVLTNPHHSEALQAIFRVLRQAQRDDLVLLYFSGHGKLDGQGRLHLAVSNTESKDLAVTSIPMEHIKGFIDDCRPTRLIIILDCCFSGAAGQTFTKSSVEDQLHLISGGRGKYILTASTATQTAQEKEGDPYSVFTKALIDGLQTGAADLDGKGSITVDDLYRYVYTRVREENHQEPQHWDLSRKGDLIIAWSPPRQAGAAPTAVLPLARYETIVQLLRQGKVIPFLGPGVVVHGDSPRPLIDDELAGHLAQQAGFPLPVDPLTLVSQKIHFLDGREILYHRLRDIYRPHVYPPALTHRFLAQLDTPLLILSTAYDTLLEEAFDATGKPYVVVTHILHADNTADRGKVAVQYAERKPQVEKVLTDDLFIDLQQHTVIYKLHGTFDLVDPENDDEIDSIVISEEDYLSLVTLLAHPQTAMPNCFGRQFRNSMLLFLGYRMHDWNFRAIMDVMQRQGRLHRIQSYAVREDASAFEQLYWEQRRVRLIDMSVGQFMHDLAATMGIHL